MNSADRKKINRAVEVLGQSLYRQRKAKILLVGMYDAFLCTTVFRIRTGSGKILEFDTETTMLRDRLGIVLGRMIRMIDEWELSA